jgi:hypothetical protein
MMAAPIISPPLLTLYIPRRGDGILSEDVKLVKLLLEGGPSRAIRIGEMTAYSAGR